MRRCRSRSRRSFPQRCRRRCRRWRFRRRRFRIVDVAAQHGQLEILLQPTNGTCLAISARRRRARDPMDHPLDSWTPGGTFAGLSSRTSNCWAKSWLANGKYVQFQCKIDGNSYIVEFIWRTNFLLINFMLQMLYVFAVFQIKSVDEFCLKFKRLSVYFHCQRWQLKIALYNVHVFFAQFSKQIEQ